MNGVNHALSGLGAYAAALLIGTNHFDQVMPSAGTVVLGGVVAVGAGLAADIDEPSSKASQSAGLAGSAARMVTGSHRTRTHWPLVMIPGLAALCWWLINHAGPGWAFGVACGVAVALGWPFVTKAVLPSKSANLLAGVAIPAGAAIAWFLATRSVEPGWWLYAAVPVPYFAHLLGDTPTPAGVAWFGPLSQRSISAGLFRSGGTFETTVVTPVLTLATAWAWLLLFRSGAFDGPWAL